MRVMGMCVAIGVDFRVIPPAPVRRQSPNQYISQSPPPNALVELTDYVRIYPTLVCRVANVIYGTRAGVAVVCLDLLFLMSPSTQLPSSPSRSACQSCRPLPMSTFDRPSGLPPTL